MVAHFLGVMTLLAFGALCLMLILNRPRVESADEKPIPHKLTELEQEKVIHVDQAISAIPASLVADDVGQRGRIEPEFSSVSGSDDVDRVESWPS
ncbi:hypothetical protein [Aeromonas hydrophila]|uniref:hypothetical protein n=1 Tax=Aeromonas hydrophila TaxID=644 RepID=UPI002257E2FE|nr:hypothetical protein [Aeromonas hydrophila]MCX4116730.1 hypothetical protein [Aeromonas hydrophila]